MNPTIIRFPTEARLGEPLAIANATPVPWHTRLHRWLFGHQRRANVTKWKLDRVRKVR